MFFALWPDPALQQSLFDSTRSVVSAAGGVPRPAESLHVTLAFLGSIPKARIAEVEAIGASVASATAQATVQVLLDAIEYWREPKVIVATAGRAGASVAEIVAAALKSRLTDAGFTPDLKAFRAHVTLARKVPPGTRDCSMQSVVWAFSQLALAVSSTGPQGASYSVLNSWSLCRETREMPEKKDK